MVLLLVAQFTIIDSLWISGGYLNGCGLDGTHVWVTNNDAEPGTKLHEIDTTLHNLHIILTYNYTYASGGFTGLEWALDSLWPVYWPDDAIWRIDPGDGSHDATYAAPSTPYPYGMAYDGRWFWYTDQNENRIYRIDPSTMITNGFWGLTFSPKDCAFDGAYLYVMSGTNTLYQLDTHNLSVITAQAFPRNPCAGLAFGGPAMWVGTNSGTGKLYRVQWTPTYISTDESGSAPPRASISPNPARDLAVLKSGQPADLEVYDGAGRLVFSKSDVETMELRPSDLGGPGVYFIVLGSAGGTNRLVMEFVQ